MFINFLLHPAIPGAEGSSLTASLAPGGASPRFFPVAASTTRDGATAINVGRNDIGTCFEVLSRAKDVVFRLRSSTGGKIVQLPFPNDIGFLKAHDACRSRVEAGPRDRTWIGDLLEEALKTEEPEETKSDTSSRIECGEWERRTEVFNELSRTYCFHSLKGTRSVTYVELRCRLVIEDLPDGGWLTFRKRTTRKKITPFVFLIVNPYIVEQTRFAAAIFAPTDDRINYKVLTVKIEAAANGVNFLVFDHSDGEQILGVLQLGRQITVSLFNNSGEFIRFTLENDHSFAVEYEAFKSELLS
jgi:hypothetical protein